ncbi:hypothetical protein NPIL_108011 [Nephila pilipes]|uniref:Uncharacterized protein n=1 Tax=Nephila pilipes TaxID=299642 RepID=A0A8X6IZC7_NEPPI|nr:hypothetical protein NPIL_108011 [Nephila pilipes]
MEATLYKRPVNVEKCAIRVTGHLLSYKRRVLFFIQWILVGGVVQEVPTSLLHIQNQIIRTKEVCSFSDGSLAEFDFFLTLGE